MNATSIRYAKELGCREYLDQERERLLSHTQTLLGQIYMARCWALTEELRQDILRLEKEITNHFTASAKLWERIQADIAEHNQENGHGTTNHESF